MTCGNKKRILFVMQSLYDGGAEKLLVDMLNNFDYSNDKAISSKEDN